MAGLENINAARASASASGHTAVLCEAATDAVVGGGRSGVFVDATFGGGGHSGMLLAKLARDATLIALDCDEDAAKRAEQVRDKRFRFYRRNFAQLSEVLAEAGAEKVQGVLFDLGLSSYQLADAARGFSFARAGGLDMRMDRRQEMTAAQFLRDNGAEAVAQTLREYGEEPEARRIAKALAALPEPPSDTVTLAKLIADNKRKHSAANKNPATKVFQALRIAVNRELESLADGLQAARRALVVGGRLAVVAFHSLEDRMVKRFAAGAAFPGLGRVSKGGLVALGPMRRPCAQEVSANPRSRSARLRVFAKTVEAQQ